MAAGARAIPCWESLAVCAAVFVTGCGGPDPFDGDDRGADAREAGAQAGAVVFLEAGAPEAASSGPVQDDAESVPSSRAPAESLTADASSPGAGSGAAAESPAAESLTADASSPGAGSEAAAESPAAESPTAESPTADASSADAASAPPREVDARDAGDVDSPPERPEGRGDPNGSRPAEAEEAEEAGPDRGRGFDAGRSTVEAGQPAGSVDASTDDRDASRPVPAPTQASTSHPATPSAATDADASDARGPTDAAGATDDADASPANGPPKPGANGGPVVDAGVGGTSGSGATSEVPEEPPTLERAGLYVDLPSKTLAPSVRAYAPAYTLWSDGATKERYVYLPPGARIDASDPDHWIFPMGTRFYKTFLVGGRFVETRLLQKKANGDWFRTTYAWSEDGRSTARVTAGVTNVFGTGYDIPSERTCEICHNGSPDRVLGFETVGLSNAGATGLTLASLNALGVLAPPLTETYAIPGDPRTRTVLGYLHANCGNACHNGSPEAEARDTGLRMRLLVGALDNPSSTDTFRTAIGVASRYRPDSSVAWQRIAPGDPAHSTVLYRDSTRGSSDQMPPFDSNEVDSSWVGVLTEWIESLSPSSR